jgi:hypothetical protein
MSNIPYASTVKSLMYAQVGTLSNLTFATRMFGRYQQNPGKVHWMGVKKALRYCQGTKNYMLTYKRSGYVFTLAGGAISWKSSKQELTAASTMQVSL